MPEAGPNHPKRWANTATHCHCGADMRGSDHCPDCGCEEYESGCDHVHVPSYPYKRGDRVMVGFITWQYPLRFSPELERLRDIGASLEARADQERAEGKVYGPSGPLCRYFIGGTVTANDREAGVLVVEHDDGHVSVYYADEFDGDEIVPFDASLPQAATEAHRRALRGEIY